MCWLLVLLLLPWAPLSLRSLTTSLVAPGNVATLYSFPAIMSRTGLLIAGRFQAQMFHWGLTTIGNAWLGLPFLVGGGIYGMYFLIFPFVKQFNPEAN